MIVEVVRDGEVVEVVDAWITGTSRKWDGVFATDAGSRYTEGELLTLRFADGRQRQVMATTVGDGANGARVEFGGNEPL
jgi:hypothetical protein